MIQTSVQNQKRCSQGHKRCAVCEAGQTECIARRSNLFIENVLLLVIYVSQRIFGSTGEALYDTVRIPVLLFCRFFPHQSQGLSSVFDVGECEMKKEGAN